MALVQCPECKKEVSDRAEKCPNCAYPLQDTNSGKQDDDVMTIELTSKALKKQMVFAVLFLLASFLIVIVASVNCIEALGYFGLICAVASVIWMIVIKVRKWWRHD